MMDEEVAQARLAAEWEQSEDLETGNTFFHNVITGESTWDVPLALADHPFRPADWEECDDAEGQSFWYNLLTGESQYHTPADPSPELLSLLHKKQPTTAAMVPFAAQNKELELELASAKLEASTWEACLDDEERSFFYNLDTGVSVWHKPEACARLEGLQRQLVPLDEDDGASVASSLTYNSGGGGGHYDNDGGDSVASSLTALSTPYPSSSHQQWEVSVDADGKTYYSNIITGDTTYQHPEGAAGGRQEFAALGGEEAQMVDFGAEDGSIGSGESEQLWEVCQDQDGNTFYYNKSTGESKWAI
jgi:hypothetical protein